MLGDTRDEVEGVGVPPLNFLTHRSRSRLIVALPGLISPAQMRPSQDQFFSDPL